MDHVSEVSQSEGSVLRSHSQDPLDTSSASSLSFFADHMNGSQTKLDQTTGKTKSGEDTPRAIMGEALKSEKAFIEFVMSLPSKDNPDQGQSLHRSVDSVSSKSNKSPVAGSSSGGVSKVGLDHLDNLCKLMEQLSELRETNNKLQKRVLYLEDLKTLHDMHKEISDEGRSSSEDALSSKPRPYELKKSATESHCPKVDEVRELGATRSPSKYLSSRRGRSQLQDGPRRGRSKSVGHEDGSEDNKSKRLFPKWSRVKEAFGWESERKDSVKLKPVGTTRMPRRSSDDSPHSTHHCRDTPTWSHEYASLHTSVEDDVDDILYTGGWKKCSEKVAARLELPTDSLRRQKSTPSPGSDKSITYREVTDGKPKYSTIERDSYTSQDLNKFDKDDSKRGKSPWGRVKTIIDRRRDSLKRRSLRRDQNTDFDTAIMKRTADATDPLDLRGHLESVESESKHHSSRESIKSKSNKPCPIFIDPDLECSGPRTPSSSPTFQRKSRWTRVKKVLTGKKEDDRDSVSHSTPASPNNPQDGHFPFDAIEELSQDSFEDAREIPRVGSEGQMHQLVLSAPASELMLQLQRNLSEDFHRKILEWERMRSSGPTSCALHWDPKSETTRSRKKSERDDKSIKPKIKDLTWLEKELQKIEKEKQRLSKERQKYEERELRLEKLKETVLNAKNSNKKEVLVRTSAGEFRFEGISDAFTKKLYEWETKRGVRPELSTIALLDSSRLAVQTNLGPKSGGLQRVVSRSESSIADIGQPSHNSSNSLPSLKLPDSIEAVHTSRANSEPDLSTLVALSNDANVSVTSLARHVIASDSLEGKAEDEEEEEKQRSDSVTYYGLLEENVLLLEQLRDKEEICRRLEQELEVLDKKVEVMNTHHTQETERYREKLWEMHKPGATPRDVQCCLLTMGQLRKRIETLEKCTDKLRNDRDSVEDSFRYHSKQQEDMTLDFLEKMQELQAAGSSPEDSGKQLSPTVLNAPAIERLQELSALLVKQTREMEETLAAKSRQISQLRWELLHRDLSTARLETELHTQSAHRKRSKYAHCRSHSSEEPSAVMPALIPPQAITYVQPNFLTDMYCTSLPASEFTATQLTNTVQQLNQELRKLASPAEHFFEEGTTEARLISTTSENFIQQSVHHKSKERLRPITVRRSSADNLRAVPTNTDRRLCQDSSSSDSDDSSEDNFTKVLCKPNASRNSVNPDGERLLMSRGEHPPRSHVQRRKKLQKVCRSSSSPGRKRSNTFHDYKDLERKEDNMPQKCQSFRVYREKNNVDADSIAQPESLFKIPNIECGLGYKELIHFLTSKYRSNGHKTEISRDNDPSNGTTNDDDCRWLREVASDSKIPLLIQIQQHAMKNSNRDGKYPARSMSDKHKNEVATERRDHLQKKRCKRHARSSNSCPLQTDSFSTQYDNISEPSDLHVETFKEYNRKQKELLSKNEEVKEEIESKIRSDSQACTDTATVTIQLPKRRSKKVPQITEEKVGNAEETFTIVMPKKRSLSSEQESSISDNSFRETYTASTGSQEGDKAEEIVHSVRDSNASNLNKNFVIDENEKHHHGDEIRDCKYLAYKQKGSSKETLPIELSSRKRKAEREDSSRESPQYSLVSSRFHTQTEPQEFLSPNRNENYSPFIGEGSETSYVKSPSAPQLDWRKLCAKKVSREGAPNVRTLIEKYNRVAESQNTQSPVSSNFSSPTPCRKESYPYNHCQSESSISSQSFSLPNSPSMVSASTFYNPLVFKPMNLDLFPRSPPESPLAKARSEALKKAKEDFITSKDGKPTNQTTQKSCVEHNINKNSNIEKTDEVSLSDLVTSKKMSIPMIEKKKPEEDRISNCSMDSMSIVVFRTGESCKESRLSKKSSECTKPELHPSDISSLKPSKSLSNSSLFKSVLSSDFKVPSSFLKLKRSKRKKDIGAVGQLCRQSLLVTAEDSPDLSQPHSHKSCPSSPELKSKGIVKSNWFQRNLFRHK